MMVISVEFSDTYVSFEELPKIKLFITSESNSDGCMVFNLDFGLRIFGQKRFLDQASR